MVKPRLICRECHFVNDPDEQTYENCESSSLTENWAGYIVTTHLKDGETATEMNVTRLGGYVLKVR